VGFEVIPAIDLRGGRCVRLLQGDFARETVFSDDPVAMARRWEACGAPRLHVVDLDGAAGGRPVQVEIIRAIARAVAVPVQTGGGLRTMEALEDVFAAGAARAVLGTAAAEDPGLVARAVERYGEAIVVGVDAREGMVATHGWLKAQSVRAIELMQRMEAAGVRRFVYTDISRDGAMAGPSIAGVEEVVRATKAAVIASGGVSTLDDLERLARAGAEGAIVGRAIYTGAIDLREAVERARGFARGR
jgi:phosphoribosylformimino-5-aminoimidazole carboxamide ribotide isomerase